MGGRRRGSHAPPASCSACHCFPGASVAAAGLPRAGHQLDRGGVHAILDAELVGGCAGGQSAQHRLFLPQRTIAPDCTQAAGGCMTFGRVPIGNAAWRSVTASRRTCYPCPKMAPRNPEQTPGNRTRGLAAPWWGGSRRERQPSHHGAFGRLSILSGILSSSGAPASNPAPPLSHMRPQLPQSSLLTTYLRSPPRPLLVCLCMCSVCPFLWQDSSPYEQRRCRERERRRGTRRPPFRRARRVLCAAVAHAPSLPRILLPATLARVHTLTTCAHMTGTRLVLAASRPGHAQGVARGRGPRGAQSSHSSRG